MNCPRHRFVRRIQQFLFIGALLFSCSHANAAVQRFAVIIGNNQGAAGETRLRYAESDAAKMTRVLQDLGNFAPADIVQLQGENANTVRRTLIAVNDRIRSAQSLTQQALLFVYYSGHADAQSLHLGASRLPIMEFGQLVRGSAATFRLLVVDACRSGTLTRVKGGKVVAPFDIALDARLPGEGVAFLTASSANEDAQESDEIQGSFFTHALVSGLLGAADDDGDGVVVLEEAYRYARDSTVRATSRTFAGIQHPTFHYDVRGQNSLALTRPGARRHSRGSLVFPAGTTFLVAASDEFGPIVGEVGANDKARQMSVREGHYFVRGRGSGYLLEGRIAVAAGEVRAVATDELTKIRYAQLVRKGGDQEPFVQSVGVAAAVRSQLPNAADPCLGAMLGYQVAFPGFGLGGRFGACKSGFENSVVQARTTELSLSLEVRHVWDYSDWSLIAGLGAGATLTRQAFDTRARAPTRHSMASLGYLLVGVSHTLYGPVFLELNARMEGHLLRLQKTSFEAPQYQPRGALRGTLGVGSYF